MEPGLLVYQILLGSINVVTACGLGACIALYWLIGSTVVPLRGVRVVIATVGLTLLLLLFTDLAIDDPHPTLTLTLLRRVPGRCLLSGGMIWFLYTLVQERSRD